MRNFLLLFINILVFSSISFSQITSNPVNQVCSGNSMIFTYSPIPGAPAVLSYSWTFSGGGSPTPITPTNLNPVTVAFGISGISLVQLTLNAGLSTQYIVPAINIQVLGSTPSLVASTTTNYCVQSAITPIIYTITGGLCPSTPPSLASINGLTYSCSNTNSLGFISGSVITISGTPTSGGCLSPILSSPTLGSCPSSAALSIPLSSICINTKPIASISYAGTPFCKTLTTGPVTRTGTDGTTYSGGIPSPWPYTGGTYSSTFGLIIDPNTGDINPSTSNAGTYTVTYTIPASGGCAPVTTTGTITVNPLNTIAAGIDRTTCINSAITTITLATTGATGATVTGLPTGVSSSWSGNILTISGTPTASGTFTYTVTTTGGCPPATTTGTIIVTPLNTIAAGTSQTVCINNAISPITLATTGATGANVTSLPTGVTASWTGNLLTISGTPTASGTFTYTVTTTGGCPPATTTGTIIVTPLNTIAAGINRTTCINSAILSISLATTGATGATVTGLPAGVTPLWSGNVLTISGTPTESGTFTYTVTTTGGCPPATTFGTITVNPYNTIAPGINRTTCLNSAILQIELATTGATGATVTGLPAGLNFVWSNNILIIWGTPTASGTFAYTVTTTGGCPPAITTGTIIVTPLNTIAAGTSQTVCINNAISPITLATTGATGATVTGLPAGVTPSWSGNLLTISGTPTVSGTFTYTVTTTGGCPPATTTGTITVTAVPTATIVYASPFCSSITAPQAATLTGTNNYLGGTYTYTNTTGSSSGLSITANGAITPSTSTAGTYTVTYTTLALGGCAAVTTTASVTITTLPTANITYTGSPFCKTVTTWQPVTQIDATGGTYSASPAGLFWNSINGEILPSASQAGTYTVTYTIAAANGCAAVPNTATVTITAIPTAFISYNTGNPFCSSITAPQAATLTGTGIYLGGTYSSSNGGLTFFSTTTGAITPSTSTAGTYTVTYTTPPAAGCASVTCTTTVTINQSPIVSVFAFGSTTICAGQNIPIEVTSAIGNTFQWFNPGLITGANGTISTGQIYYNATTAGNYTCVVTNPTTGCSTTSNATLVTVNPVPPTYIPTGLNSFCLGDFSSLSVPATSGYIYQWYLGGTEISGAISNSYNSISTSGTYKVKVTVASSGCNVFSNDLIVTGYDKPTIPTFTNASPSVICSPNSVTLETNLISTSYPGSPSASYLWSGGNSSTTNSATYSTTGNYTATHRLTYPTSPNLTCTSSQNHQVTINPLPTAPNLTPTSFCIGSSTTLSVAFNAAYTYQWFLNDIPTGPASNTYSGIASAGIYKVRVTDIITGCSIFSNTVPVTSINPPVAVITASPLNNPVCLNSGGLVTLTSSSSAGNTWSTCSGNLSTQSISVSSSCNIILTVTSGLCTSLPVSYNLIINQNPTANISPTGPHTICQGGSVNLSVTPTPPSGTTTNWYKLPDIINPVFLNSSTYAANTTGNYYCIVTNNTTNCSFESPTQVVNVTIPGTASISYPNTSYCTTSTPQAVTLIGTPGGTYSVFPINGLLVSPSTGTITIAGATPGSYTITYTLPASGGCPAVTALANVTITANTIPLFTAVGPYCSGAIIPPLPNPSLNGIIGSWSPAINNTTTTLYTFTPTAGLGQCASPVSTTIAITPPPTITPISYSSPSYCTSTTTTQVPFGVTPGGVFSVNSTGLNAWNSATGSFVPFGSVPGVYTIYYTIGSASSTCGSVFVQAIVTITQAAAAPTISYPFIEYCKSETVQQLPSITGSGGIISVFPSSGLSINSSGIITPSSSAIGIYTITYTIPASAGCLSQTANTTITIKPIPTAPTITYSTPLIFCDGDSVILSIIPTIGHTYKWWKIGDETFSGTGTSFTASTTGSYYVEITSISTTCSDESFPVDVTVKPLPNAIISPTGPLAICAGTSTTLTAFNAAGYSFSWGASHIYQVSTAGTYNVTVSLNGCSALSDDVVVSVIPNPLPGITSSPINLQACFGQAVTLQVNNITPLSDYTFEWFSASGPSVLGTLSSYSATTSGNYYIRVTSATGSFCTAESAEVAVTIHPYIPAAITLPAGSSTTFCEGTSINLTASPLIGYNHVWSNGNTLSTINLSSPIQSGIYWVIVTNNVTGCSEESDSVEITIHSNPSVPIILPNGPLDNCSGSTPLVLSANPSILPTYQWFLNSDPVGTNSSSHNAIATGNYTVISENVNGCLSLPSAPTYVTINPTPPAPVITTASGALVTFCQGGSIILSTTINFGSTYNWLRDGEDYASGVPLTVTESGTYQLIEITSSNCPSIPSSPKVITVIPAPTPTITANGNEEFCAYPGASVQLQATPGYSSYQWIRVTPSLVIAPQNSPNYTATTSGTYSVIGTINGCPSLASDPITVTVNPLPNALLTASSATTFCQGGSVLVTATPAPGGYSYVWSTTGSTNVGSPNAAVNTISYDGDYSVVITNTTTNCSQTSNAITVTVNDNPTPSIIASDVPATFCVGQNVTLTAEPSGTNLIYEWTPTSATSQAIIVSTSGSYFVTVTNTSNGCFGLSGEVPVIVNPNPIAAIISSVNEPIICQGQTITLQAAPISSSYQWQVQYTPGGSILNIGTNLPSIDVTLSGTYTVTTYNPSGCNTTSIPIDVIVNPIPVPGIIVNGISVAGVAPICQGESVVLSVIGGSFDSYQWYLNDVELVGETGNTHTATLPGDYTVEVSNGFDCFNFSTPQPVIVNPNPVANINYSGSLDPNQLCPGQTIYLEATPPNMYYSWDSPNDSVSNNMFFNAYLAGVYTVEVTDPVTGCSSESLPFNVFVNAINNNPAIVTGLGSSITLCPGEVYTFSGVNSPDISSFSWVATGGNLTNINSLNPTFTAGSIPGTFPLTLYTTIDYACNTESDSIVVNIVISNSQPTLQHNASSGSTSQSLCTNVSITPITYNVLSGSWGLPNAYVEINGSSTNPYNGISWTFANGIITISGVPTSGFIYNYTVNAVPTTFGCFGTTLSGTITSNVASLSLSTPIFTNNQVICLGDNIQNIVYNYTGTVSSFHLPNGIIASSTTVGNLSTLTLSGTPTEDGYFNYTITTVNICGTENVFGEITIIPAIIGNTSGIDLVVNCNGSAFTLIGGSINLNSIVDYDYLWEYSTSITGPFVPAPGINTNANYTGTMDISNPTLYFRRVITAGNCIDVATPVMVTLNPNGTSTQMLSFAGDDVTISLGETIQLQTNGISISNYSWSPTNSLSDSTISNPFANPTVTTNYTLTVQDIYGCTYSDDIVVNVISDYTLTIPSLITPNGDGSNDFWEIPESLFYPNTSVLIINREGQEVYSSSSYDNTWNGTFEGKLLPEATYYYFIQFSNSEITHKGPITILRNIK